MSNSSKKIFGYTWEEIQAMQQGKRVGKPINSSSKPVATENDIKALGEYGIYGLIRKKFFGTLDRLETSKLINVPEYIECLVEIIKESVDEMHIDKADLWYLKVIKEVIREYDEQVYEDDEGYMDTFSLIFSANNEGVMMLAKKYPYFVYKGFTAGEDIHYQFCSFHKLCASILCHIIPYRTVYLK